MQELADLVMPLSIGIIMFGIGLELRFKDFRRVFFYPKSVIIGLASQIILLPLTALVLVYFWPIDPVYKVGIMLIAACPGGTASNLVAKVLKGRVPLSITLTAFNSFLILFTIPFVVTLSFDLFAQESQQVDLGFWETMKEILLTVVFPVLGGIAVSEMVSDKTRESFHKPLNYILPGIMLLAFIIVVFFDNSNQDIRYLENAHLLIPLIILNILTMLIGFFTAQKLKLKHKTAYTIAIEMGLQNSVLALYISNELLSNDKLSLIAILYSSFSLLSTFGIALFLKQYGTKTATEN
ncbi:bile acid:sodium symporter family protein [Salegentibacter chungangensis]|uniref:Bile acid:sodium symporter family protein n=1 Tax=Salegentibacter chungangensis TaxID=1335724 RepID=A0ABW3NNT5_9FLAO